MITHLILFLVAYTACVNAVCTPAIRLAGAQQVVTAYNTQGIGGSATAFASVPWGDECIITIAANGLPPIPVSYSGSSSYAFGVETRQLFSSVTGEYTDFPANGTALINTNVTLGARSAIPIPVVFFAHVYLDYDDDCKIKTIRAVAPSVPSQVLGVFVNFPSLGLPGLTALLLVLGFVPHLLCGLLC
ncbi:hypothetical protein DL95DRAFT_459602 [Leptodontidium sp. 2 PMI_412]|nr:hypothetical protein BKA61DRAFT_306784 [Leptodontidium sp. MPI-SDFR-AT-0119]KAH9217082.1 hypothetical protein DL95DRAFT_459602 [Leptodontidium sp. 2 PMI_412]